MSELTRMMSWRLPWVMVLTLACSTAMLMASEAHDASAKEQGTALELLDELIIFYASFDYATPAADMAVGEPEPVSVQGEPRFEPGVFGNALRLGGTGSEQSDGAMITFAMEGNLDLSRPGAVSFWLSPHQWIGHEAPERPYLGFFRARPSTTDGGTFLVQRMGFSRQTGRNDRLSVGFFRFPNLDRPASLSAWNTLDWQPGQWRLIVVNWDQSGMGVSVDGSTPRPRRFQGRRPVTEPPRADCRFILGARSQETTLIDDLAIYRRPLRPQEITRLYEAGVAAISSE